ncbi:uncharacterized protein SPPG_00454 [Spizellomyces punctatus DAOM BR117]|uniref:Uncharacterized protein n=1 Tax=Spizellomyces punctatus (strain DAOM BR117) TaxID=645134 RepID=A0A0L0HV51_SPIPD|nr:uncharacterized protein SPPG_00454 [Spizellomyces punctatus DAOM BR117]KND04749.1 hypothetical protein SPPG_00454 [Spizellomyces punctatus DAOM BR117]|eukprot:XP_016612788.1 hypothetical protein SPPG_00454 [Spizellomyces punctatus DAOM BR117]
MSIHPDLPMKRSYSHQTTVASLLSFLGFSHADSVSTFPPCGLERHEDDENSIGRRKRRRGVGERLRHVVGKFMRSRQDDDAVLCDTIPTDPDPKHDPLSTISSDQLTAREFASLAHIKVLVMSDTEEEDLTTFSSSALSLSTPTTTILDPTFFHPPTLHTEHRTAITKVGRFTVIVESNSPSQPPMRTSNESRNSTSGPSRDVMEEFPELRRFRAQSQPQAVS